MFTAFSNSYPLKISFTNTPAIQVELFGILFCVIFIPNALRLSTISCGMIWRNISNPGHVFAKDKESADSMMLLFSLEPLRVGWEDEVDEVEEVEEVEEEEEEEEEEDALLGLRPFLRRCPLLFG